MSDHRRAGVGTGLRALGSPPAVLCLVVWALNDHVLKDQWPGWVTGKLSDLTGLVVAPLLLGTLLALLGVRRALPWGTGLVVAGFVAVKASAAGAAAVSTAWGLTGFPTRMLADPTDLLTLPGAALAVVLWRRASRDGARSRWLAALGLALLPVGVLTTAATSCEPYEGVYGVWPAERVVAGRVDERLVVLRDDFSYVYVVSAAGQVRSASPSESRRLGYGLPNDQRVCADDGRRCWRLADGATVEASLDGGRTWFDDLALDAADRAAALRGHEEACGEVPVSTLTALALVEDGEEVRVVAAASHTGIWIGRAGDWRRVDGPLRDSVSPPPEGPGHREPRPRPWLRVVEPDPPHHPVPTEDPTPTPDRPPCPSPSTRTVTPNPANGPPTAYEVCP